MKRLMMTLTLMLALVGVSMFFTETTSAQGERIIELNDSTIITVDNNNIVRSKVENWATSATSESIFSLSNSEVTKLIENGKVTTKYSFTHNIEEELFPVLRGNEVVELTHWETNNGFILTENEWVTAEFSQVNCLGTIAHWLALASVPFMVLLLLWQKNEGYEVSEQRRRSTYVNVSMTHIVSLSIVAGLGWIYEIFPSVWMGLVVFVGFLVMMIYSNIPASEASDELGIGDILMVASLCLFVFLGLVILAVPAKLSLISLILPGLLFFSGYLIAEILMIFTPRNKVVSTGEVSVIN